MRSSPSGRSFKEFTTIYKNGGMSKGMKFVACVVIGVFAVFAIGYITMSLWNWLVPALFSGPLITFWQALGLLLLSKILFWGFGGGKRHQWQRKYGNHEQHWKAGLYNKFSSMTPEEREQVKKKMKEKWCNWQGNASQREDPAAND